MIRRKPSRIYVTMDDVKLVEGKFKEAEMEFVRSEQLQKGEETKDDKNGAEAAATGDGTFDSFQTPKSEQIKKRIGYNPRSSSSSAEKNRLLR